MLMLTRTVNLWWDLTIGGGMRTHRKWQKYPESVTVSYSRGLICQTAVIPNQNISDVLMYGCYATP